jgi:tetratricopeptide (TPR) repeat protein
MALATTNSRAWSKSLNRELAAKGVVLTFCLWAGLGSFFQANPMLGGTPTAEKVFTPYARTAFQEAERRYQSHPLDDEAAWQFARACFDLADIATNKTERAVIAERGIAASRQLVTRAPNLAAARYYLGMNLAQLAQTKSLGALKLVNQMEREFTLVRELDEQFDFAGADRNLGLLYRDAPAIGSIGSRTKARQHLRRAVEIAPQYPENRLNLAEACLKWGDRTGARGELKAVEVLWPSARTNFVGAAWASSWADWQPRLEKLRQKLQSSTGKR